MGLSNAGMQNVLDSAHKIRRVTNDTCFEPDAKGRVGHGMADADSEC
ncbi:MAG: hypothetical protein IPG09_18505 [Ignavibacteria bacterium]|nr:hypothetical protein [Ignavibacteria bacterium]